MYDHAPLLDIRDLSIDLHTLRGKAHVIAHLNLTVKPSESVGLVGESGSGKSMTTLAVMRLLPKAARIVEGSVLFEGEDLLSLDEKEMQRVRGAKIGLTFQSAKTALNPLMRVGKQIERVLQVRQGLSRKEAREQSIEMLRKVEIPQPRHRARNFPHQYSGGMASRAMIAMMLAARPRLLIADEPTSGLDVTTEAQIFDLLQETRQTLGSALLLIAHDLGLVAANCEHVYVMYGGNIVESGRTHKIFKNPVHPYTQGLLSSIPRYDRATPPESTLIGTAPNPMTLPIVGCRFITRCPFQMDRCSRPVPLVEVGSEHMVFCHLYGQSHE